MIFTCPLISKFSSPLTLFWGAPILIDNTLFLMIYNFFDSPARSKYLTLFSAGSLLLLTITKFVRLGEISMYLKISPAQILGCAYNIYV